MRGVANARKLGVDLLFGLDLLSFELAGADRALVLALFAPCLKQAESN